ncbi:MAG: hypothetical protein H6538_08100 [Bacteroidales bacterium]|nr:hypothetical protein [Bacteroidales bacterium]MCB9000144.1 hypothetical protein [Bacteroidales bacterium]MCB9013501.1 hypothetical protein [Bacteroidales bacterium]
MKRLLFASLIISAIVASCYYDSEESLYPDLGSCDTLNVSYSGSIVPLMDNNCLSCHSNKTAASKGNDLRLQNYADIVANQDAIIASINHTGKNPMPKNTAKLKTCLIQQFEIWAADGSPDN